MDLACPIRQLATLGSLGWRSVGRSRVYALSFLLQRLDDHKLMIELGMSPGMLERSTSHLLGLLDKEGTPDDQF